MIGNFVATAGPIARSCATPACGSRKNASLVKSTCCSIDHLATPFKPSDQDGARRQRRKVAVTGRSSFGRGRACEMTAADVSLTPAACQGCEMARSSSAALPAPSDILHREKQSAFWRLVIPGLID
jgi:hypothetical protein